MSIAVLGLAGVALLNGFATVIGASAEHRGLATVDLVLKDFAEAATYQIQLQSGPVFASCATLTGTASSGPPITHISYGATAITYVPPAGYTIQMSQPAQYLYNNTTFQAANCDASQSWPEMFTLTATGPKGSSASLSFVVADPQVENYQQPSSTTTTTTTTTTTVPPTTTTSSTTTSTTTTSTTTTSTTTTTTIPKKVHVSAMTGATDGDKHHWDALVTITVRDAGGAVVSGVMVTGSWGSSVVNFSTTCTTNASGQCQVQDGVSQKLDKNVASETFTVTGLALAGYTYDSTANSPNPAVLTVNKP
ncbi:MAG: hypothetical protein ACHQFZ_08495 [Acidimicrobiales bacterium]